MNGQTFWGKIYPMLVGGMLLAGVVGVWGMYGELQQLTKGLEEVANRMDRREASVDKRIERIENRIWPRQ